VKPFDIIEPRDRETPLIVEVPHAGTDLDAEALAYTVAPARSLARDADLFVDELFQDAPNEGATLIVARASRYYIDLNRGQADCDGAAVEGGGQAPWPRGLVWRLTTDGAPALSERLPRRELERRLNVVYRPYHDALERLLERKRARFGFAVLLCAHSMPTEPRPGNGPAVVPNVRWPRLAMTAGPGRLADLVPGSRGRTSAAGVVIDRVEAHGLAHGFSIRHDDPYRGGFATAHYGQPVRGIHAVQIEIARRCYMDETTFRIDPQGFRAVREFARSLATRLAFSEPDAPIDALRRAISVTHHA
jgi:N-formylglutamate amidohydrolase